MVAAFSLQIMLFKPGVINMLIYNLIGSYGLGNGLILSSLVNVALKNVPHKFAGAASGVYSTSCFFNGLVKNLIKINPTHNAIIP